MLPQFTLPLPHTAHYLAENFCVSDCNREAHDWIMRWPDWPAAALILSGESGSGKTHLAHLWAAKSGAEIIPGEAFSQTHIERFSGPLCIDHFERIKKPAWLFHALNLAKEKNAGLLLTTTLPGKWPFTLPDLTSRLRALPLAAIAPPDDAALAASLRKQFSDRQLKVEEEVIGYLTPRMERSFAAGRAVVERLDAASLSQGRNVTVPFVRRVLAE